MLCADLRQALRTTQVDADARSSAFFLMFARGILELYIGAACLRPLPGMSTPEAARAVPFRGDSCYAEERAPAACCSS